MDAVQTVTYSSVFRSVTLDDVKQRPALAMADIGQTHLLVIARDA